jgi:hypothetical protein
MSYERPRYKVIERCFLQPVGWASPRLCEPGETVEFAGVPGLALKVKFASSDHCRKTRRELMSLLGKRGAAARMLKLGKCERKKIARKASKVAAIKRTKAAAARAKLESQTPHLSAPEPLVTA